MRAVVFLVSALTFALLAAPAPSGAAASQTDLSMDDDDRVVLDLQGSGWAMVRVTALQDMELNFTLTHAVIDDLCVFSDGGDGIYDHGHVSVFYLWNETGGFSNVESFTWHGIPSWSVWPGQTGECGTSEAVLLDAGNTARFIIADTTGGYTATLFGSSAGTDARHVTVPLGAHTGFVRADPEPTDVTTVTTAGIDVQRERTWSADLEIDDAAFLFSDWITTTGTDAAPRGAFASAYWEAKEIVAAGTEPTPPYTQLPGVEAEDTSPTGHHYSRGTTNGHIDDPGLYEARYTRVEASATLASDVQVGAYVITVPLAP